MFKITLFVLCGLFGFFNHACREGVDLHNLRADQVNWATYSDSQLGYSLD